ncbi:RCC1/BLIP-II [Massarina eburnea CBS 473.64]|uniref:RCC1/BLIP-II n=1 Tax=Massarina eburnea CBS 473.64 TaxID=1395130 RepID=A0A6A6SE32_9PLEO|nr:RCC1/BLIP-II [Massarina eburnea CBS 473.64]
MAGKQSYLTELPLDILVLVFPYLDAKSFLALSGTCKAFHQPSLRLDPTYWSHATRSTFRVPNQPLLQHDGVRWQKMYRRMLTQSHVFTWGLNSHRRLGHEEVQEVNSVGHPLRGRRRMFVKQNCSFPKEMDAPGGGFGIISDLQCGGWSTTVLTSSGTLYSAGRINGESNSQSGLTTLQALHFPAGYPASAASYNEPTIAIRQFSAGRSHILGLSDSGRIWSWGDKGKAGCNIKFLTVDINEASPPDTSSASPSLYGQVRQVVAGWNCSSAYVHGTGIVLWSPVRRDDDESDTMLVLNSSEVPRTNYQRPKGAARESDEERSLGEEVGEVKNYIMLEQFLVFVTDIGKVFCCRIGDENKVDDILELKAFQDQDAGPIDVQGSFRRFAVLKNGEVIITQQTYLDACWTARHTNPEQIDISGLTVVPALQDSGVISVAFGDYHFLALHSSGKITSYGTELQCCGALGLGGNGGLSSRLRGISNRGFSQDGQLLPHAYTHGRQVWFRPEQINWIKHLESGGKDPAEANERLGMCNVDRNVQGEVSEWIEQEGREWDKNKGDDGLGAHFALRVSAAGWHSGAVVLVNEELADEKAVYDWQDRSFPRLKLSDGREMPGTVEFDEWREGRPEWNLDVEV